MAFVTSFAVFGALVLLVVWYLRSKNQMEDRVRALSDQRRHLIEVDDPFSQRVMFPALQGLTMPLLAVMPTSMVSRARRWLIIADSRLPLSFFMTIVLLTTTLPAAIYFLLVWSASHGAPSVLALLPLPWIVAFGFIIPMVLLRRAAKARQNKFWRALPDSMDLLTTCVEAGLSLDFAFQRVAERQRGVVGHEVNKMLREKALGQTRREALTGMAERIDVPDVNVFVNSVIQAETLGTSIGQVLRTQARQLRMRRRQHAETLARRAAPKMAFPLVFFLMPSLFIVTIGPVMISVIQAFNK